VPAAAAAVAANGNGHAAHHLQANLWKAAKLVASAATAPAPVIEPTPTPVQVTIAPSRIEAVRAEQPTAAAPAPVAVPPAPAVEASPIFIAPVRRFDKVKWVMFGTAAAFLGVVWAAIYFGAK
jgi:hypothetical protein